ncbi:hypothetical protein ABZZ17_37790 [Streptomyces sp. NPDC006512]|uniref:hypothetical protein n=1 Tax=Streptomyces sp. NPDC006512 TaxID=3154307 RepID=UPI0033A9A2A7
MPILKPNSPSDQPSSAATTATALLPIAIGLPALASVFADRLGTAGSAALAVASLVLIAGVAGLLGRSAARNTAARDRRDQDVLDALDPLAGARR